MPRLPLDQLPTQVPAEALRFAADVEFGALAGDDPLAPLPITCKARTAQPIEHPFWGRIVHDMAGMFTTKSVIPFDYIHGDPIGRCDQQEASNEGLTVHGQLIPFIAGDRASEVKFKGGAGVPYEASINWTGDGILIEQVPEGAVAPVNGYQFTGPGLIVRRWPLRGVAICPYGADPYTETQFSEGGSTVPVRYFSQDTAMPTTAPAAATPTADTAATTPSTPAAAPSAAPATPAAAVAPPTDPETPTPEASDDPAAPATAAAPQATPPAAATEMSAGQKFAKHFGAQGAMWFVEGKTFEEAQQLFSAGQQQRIQSLEAENAQLKGTITQLRGEPSALSFSEPADMAKQFSQNDPPRTADGKFAAIGASDNVAKLAANLKLPGEKK